MLRSFSYTGSKTQVFRQGRMVLNHLPYRHGYIEPFAGSMAILLNRDPSRVEVANDIDNNIVNLLEVIRQQPQELYQQMLLTPYHETEFYNNCATLAEGDALERARKMWSVLNASWLGGPRGNKMLIPSTRKSSQGCPVEPANYKRFNGRIIEMAKRLQNVTFLCRDAIAVIKQYNYKHYVIYCDPPYRNSGNFYQNGIDHAALLAAIIDNPAAVAISGYDGDYPELTEAGWHKTTIATELTLNNLSNNKRAKRTEALYMNYPPPGGKLWTPKQ